MRFYDLIGTEHDFYGIDFNHFKLDDTVYEILEDECDGYRSRHGPINTVLGD
jgi:hypothetical protein